MKQATKPAHTIEHPPLARDGQGNLLPIPEGSCAWRICRHTGGRPRTINGPDQQPMRFQLQLTPEELVDMCGADTYRLYALDELGNVLDYVTMLTLGPDKPLVEPEPAVFRNAAAFPANGTSDLRFALEAIAHLVRTNSDALRAVAESQADWVKAIAMAKGLPRNVAFPPPPEPGDDDEDEDEDEDEEEVARQPKQNGLAAVAEAVAPYIPDLMDSWAGKSKAQPSGGRAIGHFARIQAQLTPHERAVLDVALADSDTGEGVANDLALKTVDDAVAVIRRLAGSSIPTAKQAVPPSVAPTDPAVIKKVTAVSALLEPAERGRLMKLGPRLMRSPEAMEFVTKLMPLSNEAAAEWLRANLDEIEKRFS